MIKATKPIKSTSSVPYGMLMTLVFKHFGVPLEDEDKDEDLLTWGEKNVVSLKLNPWPRLKKFCTCFDEEDA